MFVGCCEQPSNKVYQTDCPEVEFGEHIGYLSIEGVDESSYAYWACSDGGGGCTQDRMRREIIEVLPMGGDVLRVCCGSLGQRVDRVNVVVIK